jgi:glycosyltransferase involved in cell wall biosynthesis
MRAARGWEPGQVYMAGDIAHPESGATVAVTEPIQCLGRLTRGEMDEWLARAAVYLSPARYDPFGLLPLQAALAGCALLLSDIPSYRELWDGAACFFRSDDPEQLRDRWRWLLQHPEQRTQLADRARQRAEQRYTPERTAAAYRVLYAAPQRSAAA